jgi:hypothetical protein
MLLRERIVGFQDLLGTRTTSMLEVARREADAQIAVEIESGGNPRPIERSGW